MTLFSPISFHFSSCSLGSFIASVSSQLAFEWDLVLELLLFYAPWIISSPQRLLLPSLCHLHLQLEFQTWRCEHQLSTPLTVLSTTWSVLTPLESSVLVQALPFIYSGKLGTEQCPWCPLPLVPLIYASVGSCWLHLQNVCRLHSTLYHLLGCHLHIYRLAFPHLLNLAFPHSAQFCSHHWSRLLSLLKNLCGFTLLLEWGLKLYRGPHGRMWPHPTHSPASSRSTFTPALHTPALHGPSLCCSHVLCSLLPQGLCTCCSHCLV